MRYFDSKIDNGDFSLRWSNRKDLFGMLNIEQKSFENPWTENTFLQCLRQRNFVAKVAYRVKKPEKVFGFMIYELRKEKINLINFVVDPNFRRKGMGSMMISQLLNILSKDRKKEINFNIRETNLEGQLFLKARGFNATRDISRGYYADTGEDAYHMVYKIGDRDISNRISNYL
jgi:ribosomal-protein-alanine N-acetyltransferase